MDRRLMTLPGAFAAAPKAKYLRPNAGTGSVLLTWVLPVGLGSPAAHKLEQQTVVAQLQRRVEVPEGKAKPGGLRGMPGIKPPAGQRPPRKEGPTKPRPTASPARA